MRVLFCTSTLPGAVAIRALTWSRFSHVALIDGEEVIEAVWPRVRIASLADVIASHSQGYAIADLYCADPAAAIAAARAQIGKPYDLGALAGILFRRDWQAGSRWFCSELVAWAFAQGGSPLFRADALSRITPQHLWMISPSSVH